MRLTIYSVLLLFWVFVSVFIFTSCLPEIPAPVVEVVNECTLVEVIPKSTLPTVEYIIIDEYKCFADLEQEQNAKKRESLIKMDSNNCRDQYNDAKRRCESND